MTRNTTLAVVAFSVAMVLGGSVASAQLRLEPRVALRARLPLRVMRVAPVIFSPSIAPRVVTARPAPDPEPARLDCRVEANDAPAVASFAALRGGQEVASGRCGSAIDIPPGSYEVVLTLEGTLDRPERRVRVQASEGERVLARASFETSILEVRFTEDRRAAAGLAVVLRDGRRVGTLGSGVATRLSSGRYEIVARYRTEEKRYTVDLAPGQRRAIRADF